MFETDTNIHISFIEPNTFCIIYLFQRKNDIFNMRLPMSIQTNLSPIKQAGYDSLVKTTQPPSETRCCMKNKSYQSIEYRSIPYFTSQTPCHPSSKNAANNIFLVNGAGCFSFLQPIHTAERSYHLVTLSKTNHKDSTSTPKNDTLLPVNTFLLSNFYNALKSSVMLREHFSFGKIKRRLFQTNQNFKPTILKYRNYQYSTEKCLSTE